MGRRLRARRVAGALVGAAALSLALIALRTARSERAFDRDHAPPGRSVDVAGARVHAVVRGSGEPTVLLIHGNPGTSLDFSAVQERLAPRFRSLAFDRPGYGWSDRPAADMDPAAQARRIHAAARALGVDRPAVLVGFSFGGPVAIAYALDHPADARALVLVAAVADPVAGHAMGGAQALLARPIVGPAMPWTVGALLGPGAVEAGYAEAFAPEPVDPAAVARGRLHFARPGCLQAAARDWRTLETALPALAARYGELRLPVESIASPDDRIVGAAHAASIAAHVPGARAVSVPGAGHQLPGAHPDAVVAAIERALAR